MMNKDYDYSGYMTACTIRIANCLNAIDFDRDNSLDYFVNKEALYVKIENESFSAHKTIPLDFYYEDGEQLDSLHIEDFLDNLYQMHKSDCSPTQGNTLIYSAIITFLQSINPYDMLNVSERDKKLTQLALILPVKYWNQDFIDQTLRPACIQAGWISVNDDYSKLIFSNELQCRMIYLQNEKKVLTWDTNNSLLRERKYISCSLQCVPHKGVVLLSLKLLQMQYDTDFVRLCASNRSHLRDAFFSPTLIGSTAAIELPLPSLTDMLHKLKAFLATTLSEPLDIIDDALLQELLYSLTINTYHYSQQDTLFDSHMINLANQYGHGVITQARIDKLSLLTTHNVLNCLPDVVGIDIYKYLDDYLQENQLVDENFAGVLIHTESNLMKESQCGGLKLYTTDLESEYSDHQMGYAAALYLEKIQQKVNDAMTDSTRFIGFVHTSKSMWPMIEYGMRYKIYKMVELASKLKQPRVVGKPIGNTTTLLEGRIDSLLQDLPPYSFYAEAKITKRHKIKLQLHQVVCTESASNTIQKSTLPIDQVSIDYDDIYASICESMWLLVVDGSLEAHSCELNCAEDAALNSQNYTHFSEQLSKHLQEIFTHVPQETQNLDGTIHIQHYPACQSCSIELTQRTILDLGLKPYLGSISTLILSGIQSKASFGNHKVLRLLVTGCMLATWLESFNCLYQDYIWKQLEEDLLLGIYSRQLRVNLVMQRPNAQEHHFSNGNCFSKQQLFQQVSSKSFYLEMICSGTTSAEVFTINKDETYTRLSPLTINGLKTWRLLVTQSEYEVLDKDGITKAVYFNFKRQADGLIKLVDEHYPIIYIIVLIAIPYPISQEQLDDPSWASPTENTALVNFLESLPSLKALSKQTTFPMTIHVKPCQNTSKLELAIRSGGVDVAGSDDPLGFKKVYISERLTLKQIPH